MQFTIARHGRHVALFVVVALSHSLLEVTGGFGALARFGDTAMESYNQAINDWAQNTLDRLNPTYPRGF